MFALDGYHVARLAAADAADVQSLYQRCDDYHVAYEGIQTRPAAGAEELASAPPGRGTDDKFPFGIYSLDGELLAFLELFRNYPAEGEWWIGLLMLDPKVRRLGLGREIFLCAAKWAQANGAGAIQLAVLATETAALRFWKRLGFAEIGRRPHESQAQRKSHTVLVLRRPLGPEQSA